MKELQIHKNLIEDSVLTAVRSRAVTPASHTVEQFQIIQSHIMQFVALGQFNAAFQEVKFIFSIVNYINLSKV